VVGLKSDRLLREPEGLGGIGLKGPVGHLKQSAKMCPREVRPHRNGPLILKAGQERPPVDRERRAEPFKGALRQRRPEGCDVRRRGTRSKAHLKPSGVDNLVRKRS
jgi:hypothetical protein